jgi:hypothetical protein
LAVVRESPSVSPWSGFAQPSNASTKCTIKYIRAGIKSIGKDEFSSRKNDED